MCVFSALENLMREHMYCELVEKHQNPAPAPIAFFNPTLAISGKSIFRIMHRQVNVLLAFSAYGLEHILSFVCIF